MAKYDKLVPWASGGALVLSITFLGSLTSGASHSTRWLLAASWAALLLSLLSSLWSQYTSTRISIWRNRYLEALQSPPPVSSGESQRRDWEERARYYEARRSSNGRLTRRCNVTAGISLVGGLLFLALFALSNAQFEQPIQTGDAAGPAARPPSTYDNVMAGMKCSQSQAGGMECDYRLGQSLHFAIAGIGTSDGSIYFYESSFEGDYFAVVGVSGGCIVVRPGLAVSPDRRLDLAFVSPRNGKVYRTSNTCRDGE